MACSKEKIIIKTSYNLQKEYIFLNEITLQAFLTECVEVFGFSKDEKLLFQLFDQNGFQIRDNQFVDIVSHFIGCSCHVINLVVRFEATNEAHITRYDLEKFLKERNAGSIIEKSNRVGNVTESERKHIIKLTYEYIKMKCAKIQIAHKMTTAKALHEIIPCLSVELIYNGHDGGYLGKKIKNANTAERLKNRQPQITNNVPYSIEDDMLFLKTVIVSEESLPQIKAALQRTSRERKIMIRPPEMEYIEHFPFYFTNPELILFDFELNYACPNPNDLVEYWLRMKEQLRDILVESFQSSIYTMWQRDIEDILVLLKLLQAKPSGKNPLADITSFNRAIERLIVFCKTPKPVEEMVNANNIFPYIIACGDSTENVSHYFIAIETSLINIPFEFSAIQVFDLLFKIHQVFNIEYEPNLKPMMCFLAHFIYKMKDNTFKPSLKMKNIHGKLNLS